MGAQPARVAAAHAAFKGAVALATEVAIRLGMLLALTVAVKVHQDCQAVLKAHWLDGKRLHLFLRATTGLGLNAETHLGKVGKATQAQLFTLQLVGTGS